MPDLATFAVDDGFSYSIPETMELSVGSIVRVPLGGRRVRGWVTAVRQQDRDGLKDVLGVSGARPIFDEHLLQTLRWAAIHYVAPLAAMLPKAGPPNLPKVGRVKLAPLDVDLSQENSQVATVANRLRRAERPATSFIAGTGPWFDEVAALTGATASSGRGSLVVAPTATECVSMVDHLVRLYGNRVVSATSSAGGAERTKAWSQAAGSPGTIVVGTPEVALWPVMDLGVAVIMADGRRAMKARQSPTLHVRELLRRRSSVERFGLVIVGQVPTLEALATGVTTPPSGGRVWPLVEIIDRSAEPPTASTVAEGTRAAIAGSVNRNEPVFVFVSRRGYAPASRCTSCGELRRCPECGSNPGRGQACERCGALNGPCPHCGASTFVPVGVGVGRAVDDLRRAFSDVVTPAGSGGQVQVGTERDIPPAATVGLAVVLDADSMLLRPHYRAEEDTLRVLARVASVVRRGRGHRCVIQTRLPSSRVLQGLRHGNGDALTHDWLIEREAEQLPPYGELVAIELTGAPDDADAELRAVLGDQVAVFGPADAAGKLRWLIQAPDLRSSKIRLRRLAQSWRDRDTKVRVDADPLDV